MARVYWPPFWQWSGGFARGPGAPPPRVAHFPSLVLGSIVPDPEAPVRSTLEPVEPTKVRINVVVEPDELRPAIDRTARRLSREVRVPGFRKGKVPRQVIEARIGRDALLAEAIEQEAVPVLRQGDRGSSVKDVSRPRSSRPTTRRRSRSSSRPLRVKPSRPAHTPRFEVERPALEVTDEHVDAQLDGCANVRTSSRHGPPLCKGRLVIDLRATHKRGDPRADP